MARKDNLSFLEPRMSLSEALKIAAVAVSAACDGASPRSDRIEMTEYASSAIHENLYSMGLSDREVSAWRIYFTSYAE